MIKAFLNTEGITKNLQNYIPETAKIQFGRKFTLYVAMAIVIGIIAIKITRTILSALKGLLFSNNPKAILPNTTTSSDRLKLEPKPETLDNLESRITTLLESNHPQDAIELIKSTDVFSSKDQSWDASIGKCVNLISSYYLKLQDLDTALNTALELKNISLSAHAFSLTFIIESLLKKNQIDDAIKVVKRHEKMQCLYRHIFDWYINRNDFDAAKRWAYNESWTLGKGSLYRIGISLLKQEQLDESYRLNESFKMYNEIANLEIEDSMYSSGTLAYDICAHLINKFPRNFDENCKALLKLTESEIGRKENSRFIEIALLKFFSIWFKRESNQPIDIVLLRKMYEQLIKLLPNKSLQYDTFLFSIYEEVQKLGNSNDQEFSSMLTSKMSPAFRAEKNI